MHRIFCFVLSSAGSTFSSFVLWCVVGMCSFGAMCGPSSTVLRCCILGVHYSCRYVVWRRFVFRTFLSFFLPLCSLVFHEKYFCGPCACAGVEFGLLIPCCKCCYCYISLSMLYIRSRDCICADFVSWPRPGTDSIRADSFCEQGYWSFYLVRHSHGQWSP